MSEICADAVAVYVYHRVGGGEVEFLQIRRAEKAPSYAQTWQVVYGGIEEGETAVEAALREVKEEIGCVPAAMWQVEYVETFYFKPKDQVVMMPVFAVELERAAQIVLNQEHDAFRWIREAQIANDVLWKTQREAMGLILQSLRQPTAARGLLAIPVK